MQEQIITVPVDGINDPTEGRGVHVYPNGQTSARVIRVETYCFRRTKLLLFGGDGGIREAGGELYHNDDRTKGSPQLTVTVPPGGLLVAFGEGAPEELFACHRAVMRGAMLYNATMAVLFDAHAAWDGAMLTIRYREPEPAPDTALRFLFIGNSTTYFNGIPLLFEGLCKGAGVEVESTYCTFGSAYLSEFADEAHERGKALREKLRGKRFDFAVLQDAGGASFADTLRSLRVILPLLRENGAKPLLYMRYAASAEPQKHPAEAENFHRIYTSLADGHGFACAPVADAYVAIEATHPEIDLYADDRQHHSRAGAYLAACTMLYAFLGKNPIGNPCTAFLPQETASRLQECALRACEAYQKRVCRAAVFDLDGTVLDTLADLTDATNHALQRYSLPSRTEGEVRSFVGNGIRNLLIRASGGTLAESAVDELLADFKVYYERHCTDRTRPYDGIPTLLDTLRNAGVRTALVSNKADFAVQLLCDRFFAGQFDFVCGERADIPRKPSPDGVQKALQALGVSEAEAVYIGDSGVDIQTAQNAGMRCLTVTWGFRDREQLLAEGATQTADTAAELQNILFGK